MGKTLGVLFLSAVIILSIVSGVRSCPFEDEGLRPAGILIDSDDPAVFMEACRLADDKGGKGIIAYPPDAIFGYFPASFSVDDVMEGICRLVRDPVEIEKSGIDRINAAILKFLLEGIPEVHTSGQIDLPGPAGAQTHRPFFTLDDGDLNSTEIPDPIKWMTTPADVRKGSPSTITARRIDQNSEFLMGSVVVNLIFPEGYYGDESWTDDEIEDAVRDVSISLNRIQQLALWVPLTFRLNHKNYRRIPVTRDPIETNAFNGTETVMLWEAMSALGYDAGIANTLASIHNFNNDRREEAGADWVFTAFIADQSAHYDPTPILPDQYCWGGARYVLNSALGGPYMAIPYPACRYGTGGNFSNLFAVGLFHIFWGQYESDASAAHCEPEYGYLSIPNENSMHIYLGQTVPCGEGADCIMHTFALDNVMPVCDYTLGHIGLSDENVNSIPDIYEVEPELRRIYVPGFNSDTTFDGSYLINAIAQNDALPNMNPLQPEEVRIDYSPWLSKGWIQINDNLEFQLLPADLKWDSSTESLCSIMQEGLDPGDNRIYLTVENCVGLKASIMMEVTYVGMKFFETGIDVQPEGIALSWKTAEQIFDADFFLIRQDLSSGTPEEVLATIDGDDYSEAGANRRVYRYYDEDLVMGRQYRYRIEGRFEFPRDGVMEEFVEISNDMVERSIIPIGSGLVSTIVPNPLNFNTNQVVFSMNIPRSYWSPNGTRVLQGSGDFRFAPSLVEINTDVIVNIYSVRGQLVRTIFNMPVRGGILTRTWDGTNASGRAVAPGIYFLRVDAGGLKEVRKVIVLR
ncbi:MAG: T9SS type A sorting domain-containing protein [Bacteroidales bacterium]|nr:T9SS type A sorting domain-containing protein [Candidatus Latescibacterota bacterium]